MEVFAQCSVPPQPQVYVKFWRGCLVGMMVKKLNLFALAIVSCTKGVIYFKFLLVFSQCAPADLTHISAQQHFQNCTVQAQRTSHSLINYSGSYQDKNSFSLCRYYTESTCRCSYIFAFCYVTMKYSTSNKIVTAFCNFIFFCY